MRLDQVMAGLGFYLNKNKKCFLIRERLNGQKIPEA